MLVFDLLFIALGVIAVLLIRRKTWLADKAARERMFKALDLENMEKVSKLDETSSHSGVWKQDWSNGRENATFIWLDMNRARKYRGRKPFFTEPLSIEVTWEDGIVETYDFLHQSSDETMKMS